LLGLTRPRAAFDQEVAPAAQARAAVQRVLAGIIQVVVAGPQRDA